MNHAVKEIVGGIVSSYNDGLDAGYDMQQRKLDTITSAYDRALSDKKTKMPSYLHAAIEAAKVEQQSADPIVSKTHGVSNTEYNIKGTWESVVKALHSIIVNYHPHGYGTYVHSIRMETDGSFSARVSRANSCD